MNVRTVESWLEEFQRFASIDVQVVSNNIDGVSWKVRNNERSVLVGLSTVTGSPWAFFYDDGRSMVESAHYYLPSEYSKIKGRIGQWLFQALKP